MDGLGSVLEGEDEPFDAIAIGGLITAYNYIKAAVKTCKAAMPETPIIAGGGFFSAIPYDMMGFLPELDYGIVGEAYRTFPELLRAVSAGEDKGHIRGLVYRSGRSDDPLIFTEPRELVPDMDWLPFPLYHRAPLEIYFKHSGILMSDEAMRAKKRLDACMSLSCPFLCRFCWDLGITSVRPLKRTNGGEHRVDVAAGRPGKESIVRQHSAEYIGRYIEHMRDSFREYPDAGGESGRPVDFVAWVDENVVAHDAQTGKRWLRDIEDALWKRDLIADCIKKGVDHGPDCLGPHYGGTAHAGLANPDTLRTLKRIGFTYLDYGLEHFSMKILHPLGKGATPDANARAIKLTVDAGMAPIPNQIIMFPQETWETIGEMVDAWEKYGIVNMPFIMTPYPGAEWFETYRSDILLQYGGDLERFVMDLEDATKVTALINKQFTPAQAVGIQHILGQAAKTRDFAGARRLLALSRPQQ